MTLEEFKHALATDHDLRTMIGNLIISSLTGAVTGNHDFRAGMGNLIKSADKEAFTEAQLLSETNYDKSAAVYGRNRDVTYEQVKKVLTEFGFKPPA